MYKKENYKYKYVSAELLVAELLAKYLHKEKESYIDYYKRYGQQYHRGLVLGMESMIDKVEELIREGHIMTP